MEKIRFSITVDGVSEDVVLRQATIADGIFHRTLKPDDTFVAQTAEMMTYFSVCVPCVVSPVSVREMSFEKFLEISDEDTTKWFNFALDLNPHWNPLAFPEQSIAEKRKWDIEEWLSNAYDSGSSSGEMPEFEEKVFVFGKIDEGLFEQAKKILVVLELTEFAWTINDVLEQPERLLDAIFYMKNIGERMRTQSLNNKKIQTHPQERHDD